jgi:hypothetical protein
VALANFSRVIPDEISPGAVMPARIFWVNFAGGNVCVLLGATAAAFIGVP